METKINVLINIGNKNTKMLSYPGEKNKRLEINHSFFFARKKRILLISGNEWKILNGSWKKRHLSLQNWSHTQHWGKDQNPSLPSKQHLGVEKMVIIVICDMFEREYNFYVTWKNSFQCSEELVNLKIRIWIYSK